MEGDDIGGDNIVDRSDEPSLLLYQLLHEEAQSRLSHHYQSLLSGLSVIGVVIAYALLSGEFVFLAVIPLVVAFLVVQTVRQLNALLYISHHLTQIEDAFMTEYPLFSWAYQYGMTGTNRRVKRWGLNWSVVPQAIVFTFAVMGYLGAIYTAYVVWPPDGVDVLLVGLSRSGLLVIYGLLTLLVGLSGYSYYLHQRKLGHENQ